MVMRYIELQNTDPYRCWKVKTGYTSFFKQLIKNLIIDKYLTFRNVKYILIRKYWFITLNVIETVVTQMNEQRIECLANL